jgi:hypothetical protein
MASYRAYIEIRPRRRHVYDLCATQLLRMPNLTDCWELEVCYDDSRSVFERQGACKGADRCRK